MNYFIRYYTRVRWKENVIKSFLKTLTSLQNIFFITPPPPPLKKKDQKKNSTICMNHAYFNVKTVNFAGRRWLCRYACSVFYLIYQTSAHLHTFVFVLSPQMDMSVLTELSRLIDLTEPRFCVAVIAIIFNPFFWNVVSHSYCLFNFKGLNHHQHMFITYCMTLT